MINASMLIDNDMIQAILYDFFIHTIYNNFKRGRYAYDLVRKSLIYKLLSLSKQKHLNS